MRDGEARRARGHIGGDTNDIVLRDVPGRVRLGGVLAREEQRPDRLVWEAVAAGCAAGLEADGDCDVLRPCEGVLRNADAEGERVAE